jgi:riboflavin biosynthesis pyrimidine reductase
VACGADAVDLHTALAVLHDRGLTRVQCEGGPGLLGSLLAEDLVDEILLTVLPSLLGSAQHLTTIPGGLTHDARFTLTQVLTDEGTVLTRLVRSRC